jgi:hypothetical protein
MPKLYYYHGGFGIKKPNQNDRIQINLSKMAFWSSWIWGQKNHMGGFLDQTSWSKKSRWLVVKCPCPMANTFMQPWEVINIVAQSFCQWFNPFGSNK